VRRRLHSAGANVTASLKPAEVDELAALIAPWARRSVSGWPVMHSSLVMPNRSKAGASRTTIHRTPAISWASSGFGIFINVLDSIVYVTTLTVESHTLHRAS